LYFKYLRFVAKWPVALSFWRTLGSSFATIGNPNFQFLFNAYRIKFFSLYFTRFVFLTSFNFPDNNRRFFKNLFMQRTIRRERYGYYYARVWKRFKRGRLPYSLFKFFRTMGARTFGLLPFIYIEFESLFLKRDTFLYFPYDYSKYNRRHLNQSFFIYRLKFLLRRIRFFYGKMHKSYFLLLFKQINKKFKYSRKLRVEFFFGLLESLLPFVLCRLGFAKTLKESLLLLKEHRVFVNFKIATDKYYIVNPSDIIFVGSFSVSFLRFFLKYLLYGSFRLIVFLFFNNIIKKNTSDFHLLFFKFSKHRISLILSNFFLFLQLRSKSFFFNYFFNFVFTTFYRFRQKFFSRTIRYAFFQRKFLLDWVLFKFYKKKYSHFRKKIFKILIKKLVKFKVEKSKSSSSFFFKKTYFTYPSFFIRRSFRYFLYLTFSSFFRKFRHLLRLFFLNHAPTLKYRQFLYLLPYFKYFMNFFNRFLFTKFFKFYFFNTNSFIFIFLCRLFYFYLNVRSPWFLKNRFFLISNYLKTFYLVRFSQNFFNLQKIKNFFKFPQYSFLIKLVTLFKFQKNLLLFVKFLFFNFQKILLIFFFPILHLRFFLSHYQITSLFSNKFGFFIFFKYFPYFLKVLSFFNNIKNMFLKLVLNFYLIKYLKNIFFFNNNVINKKWSNNLLSSKFYRYFMFFLSDMITYRHKFSFLKNFLPIADLNYIPKYLGRLNYFFNLVLFRFSSFVRMENFDQVPYHYFTQNRDVFLKIWTPIKDIYQDDIYTHFDRDEFYHFCNSFFVPIERNFFCINLVKTFLRFRSITSFPARLPNILKRISFFMNILPSYEYTATGKYHEYKKLLMFMDFSLEEFKYFKPERQTALSAVPVNPDSRVLNPRHWFSHPLLGVGINYSLFAKKHFLNNLWQLFQYYPYFRQIFKNLGISFFSKAIELFWFMSVMEPFHKKNALPPSNAITFYSNHKHFELTYAERIQGLHFLKSRSLSKLLSPTDKTKHISQISNFIPKLSQFRLYIHEKNSLNFFLSLPNLYSFSVKGFNKSFLSLYRPKLNLALVFRKYSKLMQFLNIENPHLFHLIFNPYTGQYEHSLQFKFFERQFNIPYPFYLLFFPKIWINHQQVPFDFISYNFFSKLLASQRSYKLNKIFYHFSSRYKPNFFRWKYSYSRSYFLYFLRKFKFSKFIRLFFFNYFIFSFFFKKKTFKISRSFFKFRHFYFSFKKRYAYLSLPLTTIYYYYLFTKKPSLWVSFSLNYPYYIPFLFTVPDFENFVKLRNVLLFEKLCFLFSNSKVTLAFIKHFYRLLKFWFDPLSPYNIIRQVSQTFFERWPTKRREYLYFINFLHRRVVSVSRLDYVFALSDPRQRLAFRYHIDSRKSSYHYYIPKLHSPFASYISRFYRKKSLKFVKEDYIFTKKNLNFFFKRSKRYNDLKSLRSFSTSSQVGRTNISSFCCYRYFSKLAPRSGRRYSKKYLKNSFSLNTLINFKLAVRIYFIFYFYFYFYLFKLKDFFLFYSLFDFFFRFYLYFFLYFFLFIKQVNKNTRIKSFTLLLIYYWRFYLLLLSFYRSKFLFNKIQFLILYHIIFYFLFFFFKPFFYYFYFYFLLLSLFFFSQNNLFKLSNSLLFLDFNNFSLRQSCLDFFLIFFRRYLCLLFSFYFIFILLYYFFFNYFFNFNVPLLFYFVIYIFFNYFFNLSRHFSNGALICLLLLFFYFSFRRLIGLSLTYKFRNFIFFQFFFPRLLSFNLFDTSFFLLLTSKNHILLPKISNKFVFFYHHKFFLYSFILSQFSIFFLTNFGSFLVLLFFRDFFNYLNFSLSSFLKKIPKSIFSTFFFSRFILVFFNFFYFDYSFFSYLFKLFFQKRSSNSIFSYPNLINYNLSNYNSNTSNLFNFFLPLPIKIIGAFLFVIFRLLNFYSLFIFVRFFYLIFKPFSNSFSLFYFLSFFQKNFIITHIFIIRQIFKFFRVVSPLIFFFNKKYHFNLIKDLSRYALFNKKQINYYFFFYISYPKLIKVPLKKKRRRFAFSFSLLRFFFKKTLFRKNCYLSNYFFFKRFFLFKSLFSFFKDFRFFCKKTGFPVSLISFNFFSFCFKAISLILFRIKNKSRLSLKKKKFIFLFIKFFFLYFFFQKFHKFGLAILKKAPFQLRLRSKQLQRILKFFKLFKLSSNLPKYRLRVWNTTFKQFSPYYNIFVSPLYVNRLTNYYQAFPLKNSISYPNKHFPFAFMQFLEKKNKKKAKKEKSLISFLDSLPSIVLSRFSAIFPFKLLLFHNRLFFNSFSYFNNFVSFNLNKLRLVFKNSRFLVCVFPYFLFKDLNFSFDISPFNFSRTFSSFLFFFTHLINRFFYKNHIIAKYYYGIFSYLFLFSQKFFYSFSSNFVFLRFLSHLFLLKPDFFFFIVIYGLFVFLNLQLSYQLVPKSLLFVPLFYFFNNINYYYFFYFFFYFFHRYNSQYLNFIKHYMRKFSIFKNFINFGSSTSFPYFLLTNFSTFNNSSFLFYQSFFLSQVSSPQRSIFYRQRFRKYLIYFFLFLKTIFNIYNKDVFPTFYDLYRDYTSYSVNREGRSFIFIIFTFLRLRYSLSFRHFTYYRKLKNYHPFYFLNKFSSLFSRHISFKNLHFFEYSSRLNFFIMIKRPSLFYLLKKIYLRHYISSIMLSYVADLFYFNY